MQITFSRTKILGISKQIFFLKPINSIFSFSDQETLKLVDSTVQIVKMGKIPGSSVQIPFKIPLKSDSDLIETYHGVDISIEYSMRGEIKRRLLSQNIQTPLMGKCSQQRPASMGGII